MQVMPITAMDSAPVRNYSPSDKNLSFDAMLAERMRMDDNLTVTPYPYTPYPYWNFGGNSNWYYQWIFFQMMLNSGTFGDSDFLPPAFFPPFDNNIFS